MNRSCLGVWSPLSAPTVPFPCLLPTPQPPFSSFPHGLGRPGALKVDESWVRGWKGRRFARSAKLRSIFYCSPPRSSRNAAVSCRGICRSWDIGSPGSVRGCGRSHPASSVFHHWHTLKLFQVSPLWIWVFLTPLNIWWPNRWYSPPFLSRTCPGWVKLPLVAPASRDGVWKRVVCSALPCPL